MPLPGNTVDITKFNREAVLPYELRLLDFQTAMQDVYDFFRDVNTLLTKKGLRRLDDMLRPAIMSGVLSDMLTASLASHSRVLTENGIPEANWEREPRPSTRKASRSSDGTGFTSCDLSVRLVLD